MMNIFRKPKQPTLNSPPPAGQSSPSSTKPSNIRQGFQKTCYSYRRFKDACHDLGATENWDKQTEIKVLSLCLYFYQKAKEQHLSDHGKRHGDVEDLKYCQLMPDQELLKIVEFCHLAHLKHEQQRIIKLPAIKIKKRWIASIVLLALPQLLFCMVLAVWFFLPDETNLLLEKLDTIRNGRQGSE